MRCEQLALARARARVAAGSSPSCRSVIRVSSSTSSCSSATASVMWHARITASVVGRSAYRFGPTAVAGKRAFDDVQRLRLAVTFSVSKGDVPECRARSRR